MPRHLVIPSNIWFNNKTFCNATVFQNIEVLPAEETSGFVSMLTLDNGIGHYFPISAKTKK